MVPSCQDASKKAWGGLQMAPTWPPELKTAPRRQLGDPWGAKNLEKRMENQDFQKSAQDAHKPHKTHPRCPKTFPGCPEDVPKTPQGGTKRKNTDCVLVL